MKIYCRVVFLLFWVLLSASHVHADSIPICTFNFEHTADKEGTRPAEWLDQTNTTASRAKITYRSTGSSSVAHIEADPATTIAYVISNPIDITVDYNTMLEVNVGELENCSLNVIFYQLSHVSSGDKIERPINEDRDRDEEKTKIDESGIWRYHLLNIFPSRGSKQFRLKVELHKDNPTGNMPTANLKFIRFIEFTSNDWESDGSYYANFSDVSDQSFNGWTAGDGRAAITASGEDKGRIRVLQRESRMNGNGTNDYYGDCMSPTLIQFNHYLYHTLEIKFSDIAFTDSKERISLQLQDAGEGAAHYNFKEKITQNGTYCFKMDEISYDGGKYKNPTIKIWITGLPDVTKAKIDYIRIYRKAKLDPEIFKYDGFATPNPFAPRQDEVLFFHLSKDTRENPYTITIVNIKGQPVRTLHNHQLWDGRREQGNLCEGGVYLYQIKTKNKVLTGQIVLIK